MSPDDKVKWFIITGEALLKDFNMEGTIFYVQHILRDNSFRIMIEKGKDKVGFSTPANIKLKEYEEIFQQKLSELKKQVSGYSGKGLLSI